MHLINCAAIIRCRNVCKFELDSLIAKTRRDKIIDQLKTPILSCEDYEEEEHEDDNDDEAPSSPVPSSPKNAIPKSSHNMNASPISLKKFAWTFKGHYY